MSPCSSCYVIGSCRYALVLIFVATAIAVISTLSIRCVIKKLKAMYPACYSTHMMQSCILPLARGLLVHARLCRQCELDACVFCVRHPTCHGDARRRSVLIGSGGLLAGAFKFQGDCFCASNDFADYWSTSTLQYWQDLPHSIVPFKKIWLGRGRV